MAEILTLPALGRPRAGEASPPATPPVLRATEDSRALPEAGLPRLVRWSVGALILSLALTERIGIPIDASFSLGLAMPLAYLVLVALAFTRRLLLDLPALLVFTGISAVGCASYFFNVNVGGNTSSISSLSLLLVLYLPFVFQGRNDAGGVQPWDWTARFLANALLFLALAGVLQFALQFVFMTEWLFDISKLLPEALRIQGKYNSQIPVGSFFKANGFFMREPSNFSIMMAVGLLLELFVFRRWLRFGLFLVALLLSYSGSGLLVLGAGLLLSMRWRMLLYIGASLSAVIVANVLAGDPLNFAFTLSRVGEFNAEGSSAYMRYVAPWLLVDANLDVTSWATWVGNGPGMILQIARTFESHDPTWAKLLYEYGLGGLLLFLLLMTLKMLGSAAPVPLRAMLVVGWLVAGGYLLTPESAYLLYVVLALWARPSTSPVARDAEAAA